MNNKSLNIKYGLIVLGSSMGAFASFMQLIEKLQLLKNPQANLLCNVNSVLNCTNVLNAPQSSVFGFPNAMMSLILFVLFLGVGLVGLTGGLVSRGLRIFVQLLSLFTLGFGLWFLWQSTYNIGAICLYCISNFLGLVLINMEWMRINYQDIFRSKNIINKMDYIVENNFDFVAWGFLTLLPLLTIYLRLGLN